MADKPTPTTRTEPAAPPPPPAGKARVVPQDYRVGGPGETRYKIRATSHRDAPILYVAAPDEVAARDCYLKESGVAAEIIRAKAGGSDKVPEAVLLVTTLPD